MDLKEIEKLGIHFKYAKRLSSKANGPDKLIPYPVTDALPIPRLNISPKSSNSNFQQRNNQLSHLY